VKVFGATEHKRQFSIGCTVQYPQIGKCRERKESLSVGGRLAASLYSTNCRCSMSLGKARGTGVAVTVRGWGSPTREP